MNTSKLLYNVSAVLAEQNPAAMKKIRNVFKDLIALCSGASLTLAFAPWQWFILAFIAPALLYLTWQGTTPRRSLWRGFLFGMGFFGTGISWIFISIHTFGNTNAFLAGFLTMAFAAVLALFPAGQGWLQRRFFSTFSPTCQALLIFPALWTLSEWVRTWLLTGFPWLFVGYTQLTSTLVGFAPLISVYGISFLVIFVAGFLVIILQKPKKHLLSFLISMILLFGLGYGLKQHAWTKPMGYPIQVSLVQGNIAQELKWDPAHFDNTMKTYDTLTAPNWNSNLIVWPEAAIPVPQYYAENFLAHLQKTALQHQTTLLTGIPLQDLEGNYYNAMLAIGTSKGTYYKRHLVPFGEYLPLSDLLKGLINFFNLPMSDLKPGAAHQPMIQLGDISIAPYICYEIAYPNLVRHDFPTANLIVTISDDSWFGRSIAQAQHQEMAQMRSVETGRSQLFVTNDGITSIINAEGHVTASIPPFKAGVLNGTVQAMQGTTPWMILGVLPIMIVLLLTLLGLLFMKRTKKQ